MLKDHVNDFLKTMEDYLRENYPEVTEGMNEAMMDQFVRMNTIYLINLETQLEERQLVEDNAAAIRGAFRMMKLKVELEGLEKDVYRIVEMPMVVSMDHFCEAILASMHANLNHLYNLKVKGQKFFCASDENAYYHNNYMPMDEFYMAALDLKKRNKMTLVYDYGEEYCLHITVIDIRQCESLPMLTDAAVLDGKGYGIWEDAHYLMDLYYTDRRAFRRTLREMEIDESYLPVKEKFDRKESQSCLQAMLGVIPDGYDMDDDLWDFEDENLMA